MGINDSVSGMVKKAKDAVSGHTEEVDDAVDKAADKADDATGSKHRAQIDKGANAVKDGATKLGGNKK